METICKPIEAIEKIIEKAKIRQDADYRLSDQCVMQAVEEGVLLYHTLTCELLLLDSEEADMLKQFHGCVPEQMKDYALKRILVPADADEMTYCDQLRRIVSLSAPKEDAITSYTIFTTTDCNARCFYCYEMGRSRIPMSEETAKSAADYIAEHSKGKPVRLGWFGGEPLFNAAAIDTIVERLREKGVDYTSGMISNGYLFDKELVRKAKEDWKLQRIQITLDGTEEIYNRRKAYIYREGSAYQRVLRNIGLLLDAGVSVDIRLNLDMNNHDNLHELVTELSKIFVSENKPTVYNCIIFEELQVNRSAEKRRELYQASAALTEYINRCGLGRQDGVPRYFRTNQCMADNDSTATITPEGRLGKCEHFSEKEEMFGDIRSEEMDSSVIEHWKERTPTVPECKNCFYYPRCLRIKNCPNQIEFCDPEFRDQLKVMLQSQMKNSFEKWKNKTLTDEEQQIDMEC